ncbi:hypothetical protein DFH28DRAFT_1196268, partial [Melampsora americana]
MSPITKKKNNTHRVKCVCRAFDCYLGRYVDANGVTQVGVEVLPASLMAHELADKVNEATSSTSAEQDIPASHNARNRSPSQASLIGSIARLRLKEKNPQSQSSGSNPMSQQPIGTFEAHRTGLTPSDQDVHPLESASREPYPGDQNTSSVLSKMCLDSTSAKAAGVQVYNCDRFYQFTLENMNPVLLHVILVAAILSVFGNISTNSASWLLDCLKIIVELCLSGAINIFKPRALLSMSDESILRRIPKTITTAITWLNIEPDLIEVNCCESCFALYPLERTPIRCTHRYSRIPGGPPEVSDPDSEI